MRRSHPLYLRKPKTRKNVDSAWKLKLKWSQRCRILLWMMMSTVSSKALSTATAITTYGLTTTVTCRSAISTTILRIKALGSSTRITAIWLLSGTQESARWFLAVSDTKTPASIWALRRSSIGALCRPKVLMSCSKWSRRSRRKRTRITLHAKSSSFKSKKWLKVWLPICEATRIIEL